MAAGESSGRLMRLWEAGQVTVEVWEERDRLHIAIEDQKTGKTIADWWDDDARQMFEDGFFESRNLDRSVIEYADSIGLGQPRRGKKNPARPARTVWIKQAEDVLVVVNGSRFIIRGVGPKPKGGLAVRTVHALEQGRDGELSKGQIKEGKLYGGTTRGIVVGYQVIVGYEKDITPGATIPRLEI